MADIVYTVNQDSPETIAGFEQYSQEDKALVSSFQVNSVFDSTRHYSEIHILSLADDLIESSYNYTSYKLLGNAQSAGQPGASVLSIDPVQDSKAYGYENGGVKLLYHFLNDLYTEDRSILEFYIQGISPDRTEISLGTLNLTPEAITTITSTIKTSLQNQSYFTGFRLNFKNNDLFIATNIDTLDTPTGTVVVVKLYEPLPDTYNLKSILNIVDVVSDSVAYEVGAETILTPTVAPTLRSANFNIDIADYSVIPTEYFNYDELLSYPVTNANSQIFSTINEKSINISVDYTDFSDFIHFSSAQERLLNFKYKLDLIVNYSGSIASAASATTGLQGISGSKSYYEGLITGIVSNFDHYERFLYYESGSSSWPKSNTTKPYINKVSTSAEAITWYAGQISNAIEYDLTNYNSLVYSIPTYLRDDANNENYLTFVYMVGQHFDNLWLYSKAITDKYDADNRIDYGISKDLVAEALKNFGVKLYTSNKSVEDLFTTFIGQSYQSGSEVINTYITGSLTGSNTPIQPASYDSYQKEVQKRIYHNLPLLLKSKGTERGLRALINCYGIPGDILDIKLSGGRNINELPFFGDYRTYTGSIDKVRLDNTGSIVTGSTLSSYTSIVKRDSKYTDDLHLIEVGFSPTDNIDQYIISDQVCLSYEISLNTIDIDFYSYTDCTGVLKQNVAISGPSVANFTAIQGTVVTGSMISSLTVTGTNPNPFNIDQYLGDPRNLTSGSYSGLGMVAEGILGSLNQYNLQDYIRLIKFFDNTIFKTIKDFIPAKATVDTGVIIKPNLLNRSKAKSVTVSATQPEYTGSIDIAFITGSDGGAFTTSTGHSDTSWVEVLQTPQGLANSYVNQGTDQPTYTGELGGTEILVSDGEVNEANPYKQLDYVESLRNVILIQDFPPDICAINATYPSVNIRTPQNINIRSAFNIPGDNYVTYYSGSTDITAQADSFPMLTNYSVYSITASKVGIAGCTGSKVYTAGFCSISVTTSGSVSFIQQNTPYDLTTWFTSSYNTGLVYTLYSNSGTTATNIVNSGSYIFTGNVDSIIYIQVNDPSIAGGCYQQTGEILIQPEVSVTVDTQGSNYLYNSSSQGPKTSTLLNRFYPDEPGDRDYKYYGTPFTGSAYATASNLPPQTSGNYEVFVTVPADNFYPSITSVPVTYTIDKNVLIVKAADRLIPTEGTGSGYVTGSENNSYTISGYQGNDTGSVITGTVTYDSNYLTSTPAGASGIYLQPIITGLSAVNYTFIGVNGVVSIGSTTYNPSDYSATDYITGSLT